MPHCNTFDADCCCCCCCCCTRCCTQCCCCWSDQWVVQGWRSVWCPFAVIAAINVIRCQLWQLWMETRQNGFLYNSRNHRHILITHLRVQHILARLHLNRAARVWGTCCCFCMALQDSKLQTLAVSLAAMAWPELNKFIKNSSLCLYKTFLCAMYVFNTQNQHVSDIHNVIPEGDTYAWYDDPISVVDASRFQTPIPIHTRVHLQCSLCYSLISQLQGNSPYLTPSHYNNYNHMI